MASKASTPRSWRSSRGSSKNATPERTWRTAKPTPRTQRGTVSHVLEDAQTEDGIESLRQKGFFALTPRPWSSDPSGTPDDLAHVGAMFAAQVPEVCVLGVYRIENASLGVVYGAVRGTMEVQSERDLWHGTSLDCLRNITLNGFNRAYCGRHGMRLGQGTYFSSSADYSVRFCNKKGPSRVMFLARVLAGVWTKGSPELKEPPHRDPEGMARYDSVVNDVDLPSIFCIFRDFQALPLYLVEFSNAAR